ncbi:hypothetical protein FZEAL_1847 [Fusarium zealandicum]|uniref:Uncharacterized protein n=1 Tax=Fusarium zealandicum TaxID=1053134 RepID=A0A8H4US68_9HYPO|nr:hypothetical protein FZEAL_1847 [Fusarium zealandicum]
MKNAPQPSTARKEDELVDSAQVFDENKCRNVLVRYCAHIPRNYQYRDGIRLVRQPGAQNTTSIDVTQVFLVLRDHLGDEYLGLAGGVLYEMIEVDCQHSDDPGAAFQRWRYDHMSRHADLELPHIPHLTTVTSTITPTATLIRWRKDHPQRYRTRLSDHSPPSARSSLHTNCLRTRKDWMIEYTMYVSSLTGGTRPFRQINPQEFHEMQWKTHDSHTGRLVGEKSIDLGQLQRERDPDKLSKGHKKITQAMHGLSFSGKPAVSPSSPEWLTTQPDANTTVSLRDMLNQRSNIQFNDWQIPNANFARKFVVLNIGGNVYRAENHYEGREEHIGTSGGSFVSISPASRARSLSPRKRLVRQPLHIRMNLTEGQMDKITDAFSYKVNSSPAKSTRSKKKSAMTPPRSTPRKNKSVASRSEAPYNWALSDDDASGVDSPTFSELMPGRQQMSSHDLFTSSLAERRQRMPPPPLHLGTGQRRANAPRPVEMEDVPDAISPLGQGRYDRGRSSDDDTSSLYSPHSRYTAHPSPLDLVGTSHARSRSKVNDGVHDAYQEWVHAHDPSMIRESTSQPEPPVNRPRRSKSSADGLRQTRPFEHRPPPIPQAATLRVEHAPNTPLFSPLQFYFTGPDYPGVKKGEKTMIGANGWLERTDKVTDQNQKAPQKKAGILDSIKKIAKDMAELHHNSRRIQPVERVRPTSQVAISLDSREQSLLYCELEFNLSTALNEYITVQLDKGRLVPDKLKKIADAWQNKGRPKVIGFRYDLETQLELINLHVDDFRFYGRRQADPIEIAGLLHAMKVNARAMSIRTFCQPDSVIAKQLVDAQSLFKMLGVPDTQQIALAEIAQFFKVIVERELDCREQREHDGDRSRVSHNRGDSHWTLSSGR